MGSISSLPALLSRFVGRTDTLVQAIYRPGPSDPTVFLSSRLFFVIRLQTLWGEFCRNLVVRSALGQVKTLSGTVVANAPGVSALGDIAKITGKPITGPGANWHIPTFAVNSANALQTLNYPQISAGLGSVNGSDLRSVRNYIVHPSELTKSQFDQTALNLGIIGAGPVDLISAPLHGGSNIFESWVLDLQTAAQIAIA